MEEKKKRKKLKRANGTGTVYKLPGRRSRPWAAKKDGVYIGYYTTKTAALEALGKLIGTPITEKYNWTFAQVYQGWSQEHFKDVGAKSVEASEASYRFFAPLHGRRFRDLRASDFQAILDTGAHMSQSIQAKRRQLLNQMCRWAIREEICSTNFASFVKTKGKPTKEKQVFTDLEIAKLRQNGSEAAKIVLMLIYTGMRIGELFQLPLADYHDTYVIGGEKTEAGRNRVIPIRPEGREYFAYFANQATGPLLLSGYVGQHTINNFRRRDYYPLLERLEIRKLNPHCTRHTYASWARSAGIQPEHLQRILGHAQYSTTANVYLHTDAQQLVDAVETASGFVCNRVCNPKNPLSSEPVFKIEKKA